MKRRLRERTLCLLCVGLLPALTACRTALVNTEIVNQGPALQLLEFDYPDASFGADALTAGAHYRYSFQIEGSGPLTIHFTDASGHSHTAQGPIVKEGEQGPLTVTINAQNHVSWSAKLK